MQVRQIPMAQLRELLDEQLAHGEALLHRSDAIFAAAHAEQEREYAKK